MKKEFDSDFGILLENFGFRFPTPAEFGKDFSNLLGGTKRISYYQTLGGSDAIYLPPKCESEKQEDEHIAEMEEYIHIQQLRTNTAGWCLERLKRDFVQMVQEIIDGEKSLKDQTTQFLLSEMLAKYKAYHESIRVPLEFEVLCKHRFHLAPFALSVITSGKTTTLYDEINEFQIRSPKEYLVKSERYMTKFIEEHTRASDFLANSTYDELIQEWIKKVREIIRPFIDLNLAAIKASERVLALEEFLLTTPSCIALNPPALPTYLKYWFSRNKNLLEFDPKTRFFACIRALRNIPSAKLEQKLVNALQYESESDNYKKVVTEIYRILVERSYEKGVPPPIQNYNLASYFRKHIEQTSKATHPMLSDQNFLLPMRFIRGLPPPSSFYDLFSDDPLPSIKITKHTAKGKTKFRAQIWNKDLISKQFMKELELFYKGFQMINEIDKIYLTTRKAKCFEFTLRQQLILTLINIPDVAIPDKRQTEIAHALGMPDWPLKNDRLSEILKLSAEKIESFKPLVPFSSGFFIEKLPYLLAFVRSNGIIKKAVDNLSGAFEDVLAAFNDIGMLMRVIYIMIVEYDSTYIRDIVENNDVISSSYGWEDLIKEIRDGIGKS